MTEDNWYHGTRVCVAIREKGVRVGKASQCRKRTDDSAERPGGEKAEIPPAEAILATPIVVPLRRACGKCRWKV
jgi:hypothetical protein